MTPALTLALWPKAQDFIALGSALALTLLASTLTLTLGLMTLLTSMPEIMKLLSLKSLGNDAGRRQ